MRAEKASARRPRRPWGVATGWFWLACGSAQAADAGSLPIGPWIFASVALVLVAAASFAAGRRRGPGPTGTPAPTPAPDGQRRLASATDGQSLRVQFEALGADPRPVLLLGTGAIRDRATVVPGNAAPDAHPAELQLVDANPAARAQFALPEVLPCAWGLLESRLPTDALTSLGNAGDGQGTAWWCLRDEANGLLVLLGPSQDLPTRDDGSLAYAVSHDLRAPIRVVEGFTRIVKEDYGRLLDRVGLDHLERVLAAAARMNLMIDAVLGLARVGSQPLARQAVDLTQLAGFVVDDLRRQAPERQVEVTIEPALSVRGDPTLLRLLLENLLGNAWKYSAGVPLAKIEFTRDPEQGNGAFRVRDNGAGFDMRFADRLFGLFQRLHSSKDFAGTGVGLASVRRIVQRHGGRIWAEAAPGKGACFHFTLGP